MKSILIAVLLLLEKQTGFSQSFINLNFESANVSGYSPGDFIPTGDAFPGWSAYYGPSNNPTAFNTSTVSYDDLGTGGAFISLNDANASPYYLPIQGRYSALLGGSIPAAESTASLGQIGTIPYTAQSLTFWANIYIFGPPLQVSFNGQMLSFTAIGHASNFTIYKADISPFAGETGQLLFTIPVNDGAVIDSIQISTSSIPEPGTLALSVLGGLFLVLRRLAFIASKRYAQRDEFAASDWRTRD